MCRNRWAEGIYDIAKHSILSDKVLVFQEEVPVLFSPYDFTDLEEAWVKTKIEINKLFQIETNPLRIIGYNLVIFYAGLQSLNTELLEAADIDGANWNNKIFSVVIPLLCGTIYK